MEPAMRTTARIWLATALALGVLALILAWHALPVYAGDAGCFMPAALNQAAGRGLVNDFYPRGDPTGANRMVWHGFLVPLLYGHLLTKASYPALFVLQGLVAAAVLGLAAWWFALLMRARAADWRITLLGAAALAGILPFLFNGRPEPFAALVMLAAAIGTTLVAPRHRWWILGTALGLLATTQPGVAVLAAALTVACVAYVEPWRRALAMLAACAALALAVTLLLACTAFPFGLRDWIAGLQHHGQIVLGKYHAKTTWHDRAQAWFWSHDDPLIGMWYLAGAGLGSAWLWHARRAAAWPLGFAAGALGFAAVAWEIGIKAPTTYNLFAFAPLLCGALLCLVADRLAAGPGRRRLATTALAVLGLLPALALVRLLAVAAASQPVAVGYDSAKAELDALRATAPAVAITDVAFSLCDDQRGAQMLFMEDPRDYQRLTAAPVLVVAQDRRPNTAPDEIPGFRLVHDRFAPAPRLFGVRLASTPMGYGFAVYERIPEAAPAARSAPGLTTEATTATSSAPARSGSTATPGR
jgi:hypothetical protein